MPFKETVNDPSSKNGSPPDSQVYPWNLYQTNTVVLLCLKVFNSDNSYIFSVEQSPSHNCRETTIENSQLKIESSFLWLEMNFIYRF